MLSIVVGFLAGLGNLMFSNTSPAYPVDFGRWSDQKCTLCLIFYFPNCRGLAGLSPQEENFIKQPIGHGIPTTLYSIAKKSGIIERYKIFASLITAPITVGFGGSVGLQGPAVSTGAALGSNVAQLFHMNTKTRMLLIG